MRPYEVRLCSAVTLLVHANAMHVMFIVWEGGAATETFWSENVHFCRSREERNKYNGAYYVILYEMKCLAVSYLHRFTIRLIGAE